MTRLRNEYKQVSVGGKVFLYPIPVVKEQKYLVEIEEHLAELFIFSLKEQFLQSIDRTPRFAIESEIHSDGKTKIYRIDIENLHFNLLKNAEKDPRKSEVIEKLLSSKIRACLNREKNALEDFEKCLEKQKQCSSCKILGILDSRIDLFSEYLRNYCDIDRS